MSLEIIAKDIQSVSVVIQHIGFCRWALRNVVEPAVSSFGPPCHHLGFRAVTGPTVSWLGYSRCGRPSVLWLVVHFMVNLCCSWAVRVVVNPGVSWLAVRVVVDLAILWLGCSHCGRPRRVVLGLFAPLLGPLCRAWAFRAVVLPTVSSLGSSRHR